MKLLWLAGAVTLALTAPAAAASYAAAENEPAVVWVTDVAPAASPDVEIHQTMHTFVPALTVIPVGASIKFPNDDPFYHSVYSDSPGNAFDLGLYDTGPGKSVRFLTSGVVQVHCHVHGSMHATIVVVDGPYAQTSAPNQRIRIDGLSPGRHVVHTWTGGDDVATATVDLR